MAEAVCNRQARIAASVAWQLPIASARVTQAITDTETGIAAPCAGPLALLAASPACSCNSVRRAELALKILTDAARAVLDGVARAARGAILSSAGEAAMRLLVARARVARLLENRNGR